MGRIARHTANGIVFFRVFSFVMIEDNLGTAIIRNEGSINYLL
jgi:hypothetical protein